MATNTLDPDNTPEPDRQLGKGHGTNALGPSDTSDSGSDIQGNPRWAAETDLGLDRGTNEDSDSGRRARTAGPDIGDANLDSDSDSSGTGERATAGRDSDIEMGSDIDVDRIDQVSMEEDTDSDLDYDDPDRLIPRSRHPNRPQHRR
ncbi:MAG TPA: hypothetical protein VGE12_04000 [Noviherbaspirillum sp.]